MKPVVTLTVNPAVDLATEVEKLTHDDKLRCASPQRDAGGGGINVARVIQRLGGETLALHTAGGATGDLLARLVAAEGVACRPIPVAGETRQNFMVHEAASGRRYRFVLPGPDLSEAEWRRCLDDLAAALSGAEMMVASGSLAPGMPEDFYARAAAVAKRAGVRMVLDTSGAALAAALAEGVWLIKPNRVEIRELAGRKLEWPDGHADFARELIGRGACQVVAVSRAKHGALIVSAESCHLLPAAQVRPVSTVGAGDSFVGGLCAALGRGWPLQRAGRYAIAAAGATLLTPGTELCSPAETERLFQEMERAAA